MNSEKSEHIKKRFYIPDQDEFNCSSELLNGRSVLVVTYQARSLWEVQGYPGRVATAI